MQQTAKKFILIGHSNAWKVIQSIIEEKLPPLQMLPVHPGSPSQQRPFQSLSSESSAVLPLTPLQAPKLHIFGGVPHAPTTATSWTLGGAGSLSRVQWDATSTHTGGFGFA